MKIHIAIFPVIVMSLITVLGAEAVIGQARGARGGAAVPAPRAQQVPVTLPNT